MNELLSTVEEIARKGHAGQLYGDRDYIEAHVAPIARIIRQLGYGDDYQATGWLHDVFEDTSLTPEYVARCGIPQQIIRSALLLTKKPGQSHDEYLDDIASDKMAVVGKFVDSSVNLANTILGTDANASDRFAYRVHTYTRNIAFLQPLLPKP